MRKSRSPFDDPATARIRIYRTMRGWRWECKGRNGEVTSRGGEPFKKGDRSRAGMKLYMRKRIQIASRQLVVARIKWDI